MFKKHLFLLTLTTILCNNQIIATEMMRDEMLPEQMMSDTDLRGCCKKYKCINVCGNATIGGSLNVGGSVTASSFITPAGILFSGFRNYAILSNQAEILADPSFPPVFWASTSAANLSSGISLNKTTGIITLPSTGLFLVQYTVRFALDESIGGTSNSVAQLKQNGIEVSQPTIATNTSTVTTLESGDSIEFQISGYALINSANGNTLTLVVTPNNDSSVPEATGTDANAQMVILQLN